MSRVGKKPVAAPSGVTANVEGQTVKVKGPKGALQVVVHEDVTVGVWLLADPSGGAAAVALAQAVAAEGLSVRTLPVTPTFRSTLG